MIKLIKNVFFDISLMYRNFIHFTLSKIFIFLAIIALSIIFVLPILLILWLILHIAGAMDYNNFNVNLFAVFGNIYYLIAFSIVSILGLLFISAVYSYNFILLSRIEFSYFDDKKLVYKKNSYFDFSLIYIYIKIFFLVLFIIAIPFFVFILLISILFFSFGGTDAITNSIQSGNFTFSILSFGLFFIALLFFLYLSYKTILSLSILVDEYEREEESKKVIHYIKKSFKLTKGLKKAWYFSVVTFLVFLISLIIYVPQNIFSSKTQDISTYLDYKAGIIEPTQDNLYTLQRLEVMYSKIDVKKLESDLSFNNNMLILFYLLEFLFINGLMSMTINSLYFRLFKKD